MVLLAGLLVVLLTIFGSILSLPIGVVAVAFVIFLGEHSNISSPAAGVILGLLLASVPVSAWLAGALLDSFAVTIPGGRIFYPLALILSSFLLLQSDAWIDALLIMAAPRPAGLEFLKAGLSLTSAVILTAGLAAFVLSFAPILFEVPLHWALDDRSKEIRPMLQAIRPLFILVIFAVGFRLFTGLFIHEFQVVQFIKGSL